MKCPVCGFCETSVKDSRLTDHQTVVRRRRLCEKCGFRFTTLEMAQLKEIWVIKKDGTKEPFDQNKLARSIRLAIHKSDVILEKINSIVSDIVKQLEFSDDASIATRDLGKMVLQHLLKIDPVAYVRFASVYEKFENVHDFAKIIQNAKS